MGDTNMCLYIFVFVEMHICVSWRNTKDEALSFVFCITYKANARKEKYNGYNTYNYQCCGLAAVVNDTQPGIN